MIFDSIYKLGFSALLVFVLGACGNNISSDIDSGQSVSADADMLEQPRIECQSVAGSRLTREYIEPSEGVREEYLIVDKEHGDHCQFFKEADGNWTCYPKSGGYIFYEDSGCSKAIAGFSPTETLYKHVISSVPTADPCFSQRQYRRVGNSKVSTGQVFVKSGGGCVASSQTQRNFFELGPILEPSAFVQASIEDVSTFTRVSAQMYMGSDGSRLCTSANLVHDRDKDLLCSVALGEDLKLYCLPPEARWDNSRSGFSDSACSQSGEFFIKRECALNSPAFIRKRLSDDECSGYQVQEVSSEAINSIYENNNTGDICKLVTEEGTTYREIESVVSPVTFGSVTSEINDGPGRLQKMYWKSEEGFSLFTGAWMDTKLGGPCYFKFDDDGVLRCVPQGMILKGFYADNQCEEYIALAKKSDCNSFTNVIWSVSFGGSIFNPKVIIKIFEAKEYSQPVYEKITKENNAIICMPVSGLFYKTGAEYSNSSFVIGEMRVLE